MLPSALAITVVSILSIIAFDATSFFLGVIAGAGLVFIGVIMWLPRKVEHDVANELARRGYPPFGHHT